MKRKAIVCFPLKSKRQLESLLDALNPEVKKQVGERAKVAVRGEGQRLFLEIDAEDTVSLRSALNAYLRWINSTVNVLEIIGKP